jgi:Amidohydrolase
MAMITSLRRRLIPLLVLVTAVISRPHPDGEIAGLGSVRRAQATAAPSLASTDGFHDSHFHLTNYIQQGIEASEFLNIMGTRVGRSTLFGIPLQQQWSYANSGNFAPSYYLHTDAPLYYYSFTDAYIATAFLKLPPQARARFDPMITGFNPADMYAVDHIKRVLTTFPGVFTGIGEFSIHKEFVSAKIAGETASLINPALDRILEFAGESGLVVILHNDIDVPFGKVDSEPVYLTQTKDLLERHPRTAIIWAHTGLGRIVRPVQVSAEAAERTPTHLQILEAMLTDPALRHVSFDISWDEVAKYAVSSPEVIARVTAMFNQHADRILFGTDVVAPVGAAPYYRVFDLWAPVWAGLTPDASQKVRKGNYERIFDEGRRSVRAWEQANVK